jgi:hypothetical protein
MFQSTAARLIGICLLLSMALGYASERSQRWSQTSSQGEFLVELMAPDDGVALSKFDIWQLSIKDAESKQPVTPVRVVVGGGMPAHGHGLPTQPQVTKHIGGGQYQLEGLTFNMAGQWQLVFDISTGQLSDRVVFDLQIEH